MIKRFAIALATGLCALTLGLHISDTTALAAASGAQAGTEVDTDGILDASGFGNTDNGFVYRPIGTNCSIVRYEGTQTAVNVPTTITAGSNSYSVTSIEAGAFSGNALMTTLTIPEVSKPSGNGSSGAAAPTAPGISSVGPNAFSSCPSLTTVNVASTVTSIGDGAFSDCPALTNIAANSQRYKTIDGVLYEYLAGGTTGVTGTWKLVQYPVGKQDKTFTVSSSIANNVTSIGVGAFAGSLSLESITLPDRVSGIMASAFQGCEKLTTINIPFSVTCIPDYCFEGCKSLKTPLLPESITNICPYAFANCSSLDMKTLPSGLITIDNAAFYNCDLLTQIELPWKVEKIGDYSFAACENLSKVTATENLKNIGSGAFAGDNGLTIYAKAGSEIQKYAAANRFGYVSTYTVNFYSDETKTNLLKSEEVVSGSDATPPVMVDRPGFKMTWFGQYQRVTSNSDVYASYSRAYTVTFIDNFQNRTDVQSVDQGQSAKAPNWKVSGYRLNWSNTNYSYVTSDLTIYAQWVDPKTGFIIDENVKVPLGKGKLFETTKARYRVLSDSIQAPTVTYIVGTLDAAAEEVTIPKTVKYEGVTYKVVRVAENAFRGNTNLKKIKLGANIKQVRPSAFEGCSGLENIIIYSKKITKFYYDCFVGIADGARFRVYPSKKAKYTTMIKKSGMTTKYKVLVL